jgi:mandelate racemase
MHSLPALTIRRISAVGVEVPMRYALGTSRGRIVKAPLLLIDVETAEGVIGRTYLWAYFPQSRSKKFGFSGNYLIWSSVAA